MEQIPAAALEELGGAEAAQGPDAGRDRPARLFRLAPGAHPRSGAGRCLQQRNSLPRLSTLARAARYPVCSFHCRLKGKLLGYLIYLFAYSSS